MCKNPVINERDRTLRQNKVYKLGIKLQNLENNDNQVSKCIVFAADVIDNQRQQLEERAISMESTLAKTKKELLEAKKQVT